MGVAEPATDHLCRNCGSVLNGPYCSRCGQQDLPADPSLRELFAEAWDAFISVDGKVLASLRTLLLRPGTLTTEYLRGHRVRYLPPLRLYLVCSVTFFLVAAMLPAAPSSPNTGVSITSSNGGKTIVWGDGPKFDSTNAERAARQDSSRRAALAAIGRPAPPGPLDSATFRLADSLRIERKIVRESGPDAGPVKRWLVRRFIVGTERASHEKQSFLLRIKDGLPRMMFVLMPGFAILLALLYRSRRRRYPTHLIVALHLHAFGFVVFTLGAILGALPRSPVRRVAMLALTLWFLAYIPLALRQVYGGRLTRAVARAVPLLAVYAALSVLAISLMTVLLFFVI